MATTKKAHYVADVPSDNYEHADAEHVLEDRHQEYEEVFSQDEETPVPVVRVLEPASTFAYSIGHRVQPEPNAPARSVIWRGQHKERHPTTGLVHRINVYRLDDGFWDCYREDELQAA